MHRTPKPLSERFWPKVDKSGDCWIWTGARYAYGYGQISISRGKSKGAHRVAWELTNGPIPNGMFICHKCDNPPCVRPDHLYLGSPLDNAVDRVVRGRAGSLLTADDVLTIRRMRAESPRKMRHIYDAFPHVSKSALQGIVYGAAARHIKDKAA